VLPRFRYAMEVGAVDWEKRPKLPPVASTLKVKIATVVAFVVVKTRSHSRLRGRCLLADAVAGRHRVRARRARHEQQRPRRNPGRTGPVGRRISN
jgi:hypothetical protein